MSENKKLVHEGRHLNTVEVDGWEFVTRRQVCGVVVIAALTADNKLILVEQFRIPLGRSVIELPAGLAGDVAGQENEKLAIAAARELQEETGYEAHDLEWIAEGPASAGLTDEFITFFLTRKVSKVGVGGGDEHEDITVHEIPLENIHQWTKDQARQGKLIDNKIWVGLYFLMRPSP
ncbi:MAG: NUDIX hydrolase [Verrucomicrobiota bacterium]|nr:NUDIX hydrolase [Verrucomicrobiota bacterium]